MADHRFEILAKNLINYSCDLKPGEKVLIENNGFEIPLTCALIREAYAAGAIPFVNSLDGQIQREILKNCSPEQIKQQAAWDAERMNAMDAYVGIRAAANSFELAHLPQQNVDNYNKFYNTPVHHNIRVAKTKWVILRYPNAAMAQLAGLPTQMFEDHFFQVCNLDYAKLSAAMQPLVELMSNGRDVRIVGENCDLTFSIAGIPAIPCDGKCNIPDGEVYTAPVKDSMNGHITFNTPSVYQGTTFTDIHFEFENGKIVRATSAGNEKKLNAILDTDEGGRYLGEFAIGVNPFINEPICDTLFDEKINGSIHITPGCCYDDAPNGNKSAIHWDLVYIQTPQYGGGEIYIDGRLIRKDGRFVVPELQALNAENFK